MTFFLLKTIHLYIQYHAFKNYQIYIAIPKLLFIDCKEKCCGSECQLPSSSNGNQSLYVGVSLGTLVFVILIVVAVFFIVRRLKPDVVDNTYLEPVHTYNTINKTLRESDHYDTIQDFHNEECK